jgi:hypothetical protein
VAVKRRVVVAALVLLMETAYVSLLRFEPRAHMALLMVVMAALFALYAAAVIVMRHIDHRIILAAAVLFHLTLLPLGLKPGSEHFRSHLLLDDDVWRYLWDGHVTANGENPYGVAPRAQSVPHNEHDDLCQAARRNVNHPDLPTIYPPVSQLAFFAAHALAPGSILALKIVLVACDLLTIVFLIGCLRRLGRPANDVLLYAWNPLVILMFAGAAHMDVIMVMLLSLAMLFLLRGSKRAAGVALGLATMTKLAPIVVWPFFVRRIGRSGTAALLATTILAAAPLAFAGGGLRTLRLFASTWDFNSAAFAILRNIARPLTSDPGAWARLISVALLAFVIFRIDRRSRHQSIPAFPDTPMNAFGVLLVLSPTVMPWYATWPLAFVVLARRRGIWISFSALVCLSFPMTSDWKTHAGWLTAEYGALAAVALFSEFRKRTSDRRSCEPQLGGDLDGAMNGAVHGTSLVMDRMGMVDRLAVAIRRRQVIDDVDALDDQHLLLELDLADRVGGQLFDVDLARSQRAGKGAR